MGESNKDDLSFSPPAIYRRSYSPGSSNFYYKSLLDFIEKKLLNLNMLEEGVVLEFHC